MHTVRPRLPRRATSLGPAPGQSQRHKQIHDKIPAFAVNHIEVAPRSADRLVVTRRHTTALRVEEQPRPVGPTNVLSRGGTNTSETPLSEVVQSSETDF